MRISRILTILALLPLLAACGGATVEDLEADRVEVRSVAEEVGPLIAEWFDAPVVECVGQYQGSGGWHYDSQRYRVALRLSMESPDIEDVYRAFESAGFVMTQPETDISAATFARGDIGMHSAGNYESHQLIYIYSPLRELAEGEQLFTTFQDLLDCSP